MRRPQILTVAALSSLAAIAASPAQAAPRVVDVTSLTSAAVARAHSAASPAVLVPRRLPVDADGPIAATLVRADRRSYGISIGAPGCNAAHACEVAHFSAFRGLVPTGLSRVRLARGVHGFFTPTTCGATCSRPIVAFRLRGVAYYIEALPTGRNARVQLVRLANQAILAGPR